MEWIKAENQIPDIGIRVLGAMSSGLISVCYVWRDEWRMNDRGDKAEDLGYTVTHWMLLPEPPKQEI